MGSADIVPGVSGGTVALVLGIYERLIANIHRGAQALKQLLTGHVDGFVERLREVEWVWLLSLLAGVLTAVALLSKVIERLLHDYPIQMAGLFFGLVIGSAIVAWRLVRKFEPADIVVLVGVAITMFVLLGLRADTAAAENATEAVTRPWWVFFGSGALAICAMILPGISGSFILVLIGMYTEVLGAVNERAVLPLVAFMLGAVVGLALFSSFLTWALDHYHDLVISAMIGLMLGSLRVLWPWPGGTQTTTLALPSAPIVTPILLGVAGFGLVMLVEVVATRTQRDRS